MMLRPAIGNLLDKITTEENVGTRYELVIAVAKRAREIAEGFKEENIITDEKPVLLAVEDFKNHKYNILEPESDEV